MAKYDFLVFAKCLSLFIVCCLFLLDIRAWFPGLHSEFRFWWGGWTDSFKGESRSGESCALLYLFGLLLSHFLLQLYQEHQSQIRTTLHWLPDKLLSYYNLEWRLEVQVDNSCLKNIICWWLHILTLKIIIQKLVWSQFGKNLIDHCIHWYTIFYCQRFLMVYASSFISSNRFPTILSM